MIEGVVTFEREAVVRVIAVGAFGQEVDFDGAIDTGFTGFLTLPPNLISSLGWSYAGATQATLADASHASMAVFEGTVRWDGRKREVLVLAVEGAALIGMALLLGNRVTLDVEEGGPVRIEALR